MSAKILTIIPEQRFETLRDQIALILAEELSNQHDLIVADGGEFDTPTVWTDRYVSFDKTELPAVVVTYANGEYGNQNQISAEGNYSYFIDVYTNADTEADADGYKLSHIKLDRILGMVRYILSSPYYSTLGFTAGWILNRTVQNMGVFTRQDVQDALSDAVGRIVFTVRAKEQQDGQTAIPLELMATTFKINGTNKGYKLETNFE